MLVHEMHQNTSTLGPTWTQAYEPYRWMHFISKRDKWIEECKTHVSDFSEICMRTSKCPKKRYDIQKRKRAQVTFCQSIMEIVWEIGKTTFFHIKMISLISLWKISRILFVINVRLYYMTICRLQNSRFFVRDTIFLCIPLHFCCYFFDKIKISRAFQ